MHILAITAYSMSYMARFVFSLTILSLLFSSCRQEEDAMPPTPISYTTLVYMAADNNMDSQVDYTLEQLKSGAKHSTGTVVVYLDRQDETPRLFTVTQSGEEKLLKTYGEGNAASASTLAAIIADAKSLAPADQYYGPCSTKIPPTR